MRPLFYLSNKKGSSLVILAISFVVIAGFTSLAVDFGVLAYEKNNISKASDSAALAGAQQMAEGGENVSDVVDTYLLANGVDPQEAQVEISYDDRTVKVSVNRDVEHIFAKLIGIDQSNVLADATVKAFPIASAGPGVKPFAIEDMAFEYGETYTLKQGGGDGYTGNYGCLALGGTGSSTYENNLKFGYDGVLEIGQIVTTETGNMSNPTKRAIEHIIDSCSNGCTFDDHMKECPRLITVVIVDSLDVGGRSDVEIVGFASFFLEGVGGQGNECNVTGKFVKTVATGEMSETGEGYGLMGLKLVD